MAQRLDIRIQLPKGQRAFPVLATLEGERKRTGIVLATPKAQVVRIDALAAQAAGPLNLELERSLRAVTPLLRKPADRIHHIALTGSMTKYVWSLNSQTYPQAKPFMIANARELYDRMLQLYPDRANPGSLWASAVAAKMNP
jgi:hypothetical protein